MTQEEKWLSKYDEVVRFIQTNKRNPSKHRVEEHLMLNWVKHNRKVMSAGEMRPERKEKFEKLMELWEQHRRKNQW